MLITMSVSMMLAAVYERVTLRAKKENWKASRESETTPCLFINELAPISYNAIGCWTVDVMKFFRPLDKTLSIAYLFHRL